MTEEVVSVDPKSKQLGGVVSLIDAHTEPPTCHLAVSVQLVDRDGRWLIAQRASSKRSFAGLWSNTCCTHPRPGEDVGAAAKRRVFEELGVSVDALEFAGDFVYRAPDPNSEFVEYEWDHVYVGSAENVTVDLNQSEVESVRFVAADEVNELLGGPDVTPWFADVAALAKRYLFQ